MAIVTLLTDSGANDHYVAAIKARIFAVNPGIKIVDITHGINPCNLAQAAYVLRGIFRDFPKGTVHLIGVHASGNKGDALLAVQLEDHFFVTADHGLLGMISDKQPTYVVALNSVSPIESTFTERDIFAAASAKLASGVSISDLGKPLGTFKKMIDRAVKATKKQIIGQVIHVDNFGNAITNIPKEAFDILSKDKVYTIQFGREKFRRIQTQYNQVEEGDVCILFNSLGLLEVAIYKGNASELFGLTYDSVVSIIFEE